MSDKKTGLNLEASIAKSIFLGNFVEENIFPFPKIDGEEAETLRIVLDSIDKFMDGRFEEFREFDRVGEQPEEYIESLKELGLFGLIIPEEYGGIGFSNTAYSRVLQQTSRYDASTSLTIGAHSSIGLKGLVLFGTDEQKQQYLPKLATGEMIAAFCLTEPGSGSDAASISTNAAKQDDGSWVLNGEKIWITNGPLADFFTVFARTESENGKISAFIVEKNWEGVSTGPKEDKMGIRASATSSVFFENVKVPAENLLGEEGKGFKVAMSILNSGRTGLGGGCVGAMKACIQAASRQAVERKQFGQSISEFGLVKEKITQMTVNCFATESMVSMLGYYIDSGVEDFSVEAAVSKVFSTEALWNTANEGLQIAAGNGFMREYPYEMVVRDSRINMIYEGTNEILRLYIALSGMKHAGSYLKSVQSNIQNIFNDPIKGFGVLTEYAGRKLGFGVDKLDNVHPKLRDDAEIFERYTTELAKTTETLLKKHGKKIIDQQHAMKRVANIAIDIVVGSAVLSRVSALLEEGSAEHELEIAHIFSRQASRRMYDNLRGIERNEDSSVNSLSDFITSEEGYLWDTI